MSSHKRARIGIDARLIRQTGVGVYVRNLLEHLKEYNDEYEFVAFVQSIDRAFVQRDFPYLSLCTADERWHSIVEQTHFLATIVREHVDLMHFTYFSYPILYRSPFICTIHDLTPLLHKTGRATQLPQVLYEMKHMVLRLVLRSALKHARAIITPSNAVKQAILQTFPQASQKSIHPIYEGVNEALLSTTPSSRLPDGIGDSYFLYVGNYYPHKNVSRLVEAYMRSGAKQDLVLVGPEDIFSKRLRIEIALQHADVRDRIHLFHDISDAQLIHLYKGAHALVHPAVDEGFGLTLAEAQALGTPILASDIPVFHELFEGFVTFFDPHDTHAMARVIQECGAKPRSKPKPTRPYSFAQMTKETVALYRKCLSNSDH